MSEEQSQVQVQIDSDLMSHEDSMDKIAVSQGAGFARVDRCLDRLLEHINHDRVVVSQLESTIKTILERVEILEKQNADKDSLINDLNCQVIELSKKSCLCSGRENTWVSSSGLGIREDPFELEDVVDEEPIGSQFAPAVVGVGTGLSFEGDLGEIVPDSEEEIDGQVVEGESGNKDERGFTLSPKVRSVIPETLACS